MLVTALRPTHDENVTTVSTIPAGAAPDHDSLSRKTQGITEVSAYGSRCSGPPLRPTATVTVSTATVFAPVTYCMLYQSLPGAGL